MVDGGAGSGGTPHIVAAKKYFVFFFACNFPPLLVESSVSRSLTSNLDFNRSSKKIFSFFFFYFIFLFKYFVT